MSRLTQIHVSLTDRRTSDGQDVYEASIIYSDGTVSRATSNDPYTAQSNALKANRRPLRPRGAA